mmetsp:Transcript_2873/g.7350  ORF Transcript_2873/g.7350 Transcript_2873/m.7350 type:complete len:538 (+) Transcript_2873:196-1809(+)
MANALAMGKAERPVGSLAQRLPAYAHDPPIEAVVFAWGVNEDSQLGLDSRNDHSKPKVVESLLGTRLRGRAFGVEPLVTGSRGTLAIGADGRLLAWGWNARGTLGLGHRDSNVPKPCPVKDGLQGVRITQAALGGWHSACVDDRGQVYSWGGNEYGQCGVEASERDIVVPRPVLQGIKVKEVSCGGMHSIALTAEGEVLMWGERWGDFSLVVQRCPRKLPGVRNIARIAAGAFHNLALTEGGQVLSWGTNDFGQLGIGTTEYATLPVPVEDLDPDIADIFAGGWHSLAINKYGEVFTWGRGEYGRLGVGDRSGASKMRPCQVSGIGDHIVVQASCGGTHTLLQTSEGRMFAFGRGSFGRLGASMKDHYSPIEVELPGGYGRWKIVSVAAGGRHSMALAVPYREDLEQRKFVPGRGSSADSLADGEEADVEEAEYEDDFEEEEEELEEVGSEVEAHGGVFEADAEVPEEEERGSAAGGGVRKSLSRGGFGFQQVMDAIPDADGEYVAATVDSDDVPNSPEKARRASADVPRSEEILIA